MRVRWPGVLRRVDPAPVAHLAWIALLLTVDLPSARYGPGDLVILAACAAVVCGAVAARTARPGAAAVAALALATGADLSQDIALQVAVQPAWAHLVGRAGWVGSRAAVAATALACAAVAPVGLVVSPGAVGPDDALVPPVPLLIGLLVRAYDRRQRDRTLAAQRRAWEDEQAAVERERARIARELHDVVAHHVSGMVVSAGAALRVVDRDPAAALAVLDAVADSTDRAAEAMRVMVGALPGTDGAQVGAQVDTAGPGLDDLPDLVEEFDGLGCRVRLDVDDDLAVPPDVGLTVFRIVQEGLTNALKHAGPVPVSVRVARGAGGVDVHVEDPGRGSTPPATPVEGAQQGLVGMAERVAVFDGTLHVGPTPVGGWAVRATLPLTASAAR